MKYKLIGGLIIALILLLTVFFGYQASKIRFNYDIESFFSKSDPDLSYYLNFRETFENDNDFVLIGISNREGIFQKEFLSNLDSLTHQLERFQRITAVSSPTNLYNKIIAPLGGIFKIPVVHVGSPEKYDDDARKIYGANDYASAFFSPDTHAVLLFIKKEEFTERSVNDSLLTEITAIVESYGFDEYHLAGRINTQHYYVNRMNSEMVLFAGIAISLLIGFLVMIFRCFVGVFIPILVLSIAVTWTFAFIQYTGGQLDLMMTMLPTLLFVIGISNSVHLISKYIDELGIGSEKMAALKTTFREIGWATFLTSFTTAAGFMTLMIIDIEPIQKFGFYAAIGVMITYLISMLLVPAILVNIKPYYISCSTKFKPYWDGLLHHLFSWVFVMRRKILMASFLVTVIALAGISQIRINNNFLDDLDDESSLKRDLLYFEEHFAGIRPFEMGIDLRDTSGSVFTLEVLLEIEKIETYLRSVYGVGFIYSPVTIVKSANKAANGGGASQYKLPGSEKQLKRLMKKLNKYRALKTLKYLVTENQQRGRLTGKMKDSGSQKVVVLNEDLMKYITSNAKLVEFTITGAAQLMDNTNSSIAINLVKGLSIAIILIAIIVFVFYGSAWVALISLIPNTLPLVFIAGLMGLLDIELKVATALIFTIAFGISVDDTIHFLSRLKIELKNGNPFNEALKKTYLTTGKAIIMTSVILSAGFLTFMLSEFRSTFSIGLLISITLFVALMTNLVLLPLLLNHYYSRSVSANDE